MFDNFLKRIIKLFLKPTWSFKEISRLIFVYYSNIWFKKRFNYLKIEKKSFKPQSDDLRRIWNNIFESKPNVCLEYGSGISSAVILDAMSTYSNKGKLISIESDNKWAKNTKKMLINSGIKGNFELKVLTPIVEKMLLRISSKSSEFWYPSKINPSKGNFICLKYEYIIRKILPDFVYIDGPDPNNIRGFRSSNNEALIPCVIDILFLEKKLKKGTLILIDGRDFNANILWSNFKRKWRKEIFNNQGMTLFRLIE